MKDKIQKLIQDLPSAPKEGDTVDIDAVFHRCLKTNSKHIIHDLMEISSEQRLKILQETPEYRRLLKFAMLVRDGRVSSHGKVQDFLDTLEPILHEISLEAFDILGHAGHICAYEELKKEKIMLKPLRNQIIVKPIEEDKDKKTAGGLIIPGTVVDPKWKYGKVIAVGPGYLLDSGVLKTPDVKVDDIVLHGTGFAEIIIDNETHLVMADDNCLAVKTN